MITDIVLGDKIEVCIRTLKKSDVYKYNLFAKNGWFKWNTIFDEEENQVFGMFLKGKDDLQGVIAIQEHKENQLIHIELMEAAPVNRLDHPNRKYTGVGKNLLCFAIHQSFELGYDGYIGLSAKRNFNDMYYLKLGAIQARGGVPPYFYFPTRSSIKLVQDYMPGGVQWCRS